MAERKRTNGSSTLEDAFSKLLSAIQTIDLRQTVDTSIEETVKPREVKRIQHAFGLLHGPKPSAVSRPDERQRKYWHFLRQLKDDELVVASALGLGQTAIANMKEAQRLRLPVKLKQRKRDLELSLLTRLAQAYSKQGQ